MKYFLSILGGALGMYIILKVLSSKGNTAPSQTTAKLKALAKTAQAYNLIMSPQFRELVKTKEFSDFVRTLANEQISIIAGSLTS